MATMSSSSKAQSSLCSRLRRHLGLYVWGLCMILVQERCCLHELHNLWFRVHWEVIQGPAYCEYSADLGSRLMVHSRMVVEILEQQYPRINPQKPKSPKVFDDVFRCDEHERFEITFGENDPSKMIAVMRSGMRGLFSKFNAVHDGKDLVFREE